MDMRKLYYQIPMPVKRMALSLIPYRYVAGKAYRDTLKLCQYLESAEKSEVKAFQEKKLQEILTYAVNKVPFYKPYRSKVENAVSYRDVLNHFPVINKKTVQDNFSEFISDDINSIRYLKARTGGSSGNQLMFYQDCRMYSIEMAFIHHQWARFGYQPSCKKATFRGIKFSNMKPGTFWQYNPIHNELQFSPFYMSESNLELYVKRLQQYKPEFLHGYPSAITILADYIAKYSLQSKIQPVKAIFCSSEACTPYQRSKMEQTFQCPVYPFYGQSERVAWAGECDEKNIFHTFPGYSFCEILTADSIPVKSGECGEITGTGFWNYSMPLIRYATDDTARLLEESSGKYYHTITLDQLHGRRKSGVYGKDNVWISSASLELYDSIFKYITAYQYYQREPGKLEILIVPNCNWQSNMADKLLASHRELLGDAMDMKVILTDDIPCTSGGKRLLIRQDYKPEDLDA